jgi:maleylacetate reductase
MMRGSADLSEQRVTVMDDFIYNGLAARVLFGGGTVSRIRSELELAGCRRALVLATPEQKSSAARIGDLLGDLAAGVFAEATMHTPVGVTEKALQQAEALQADCTVAIGGGSTTGLGKAIALRTDLTQFVIPTTYAGSEMTPILGETRDGAKTTQRTLKVLPEVVIYDVDLTLTLPAALSATSGMNAIAHAAEALYAQDRNPIVSLMAEEAIRALGTALPAIIANPADRDARSSALYGAWLCGMCLGSVGMALHHKLCHVLGGSFDLPHAETHTVILPHAFAYNAAAAPEAAARVARALGGKDAALDLFALSGRLGAPRSLQALGMPQDGIERAADIAVKNPYWNPRPIERDAIRDLIARAWAGDTPHAPSA